ncbi:DUF4345 domain-containing protein [Leptospira gomenensis]|uniref:DUF4345 domain-containing protein n=1 Tax=Leptospira gomenensis TaxID=2484974 RepID=A0A5F1YV94_9LEPT|nr:DUF4345 domain-containing protein [Leptospira gomenensis]TGK31785.1 DUF4345 domain-containing protein [Leptospira gomenensis]TGK34804.1 DUF4345 domain-containing protein [Leptospira gomenensis]TGK41587.1 DUF4345 domain-containing protein [Leptospira gomenensis]TGK61453.1 DUF4345 domain-containing protein [Leptospira gomenensis]
MNTNRIAKDLSAEQEGIRPFLSKVYILLNVVVYLGFGIAFMIFPLRLASLIGITVEGSAALADFRAMYGGLCLGIEIVLFFGFLREEWRRFAIFLSVTTAGGLLFGRLCTLFLDGPGNVYIYVSMGTEIGAVAIGVWLLQRTTR